MIAVPTVATITTVKLTEKSLSGVAVDHIHRASALKRSMSALAAGIDVVCDGQ